MKILAIESSCDETAAAVIEERDSRPLILSNVISSQVNLHKKFGGVVPEVAARAHIENILPIIDEALKEAGTTLREIDYLAITDGPGLIGSLVVGVETAKALAVATGLPLIPVNHLEGHIYASFARGVKNYDLRVKSENKNTGKSGILNSEYQIPYTEPRFPILSLLVSGGNTLLILVKDHQNYEVVGQTLDDAAGEAFDKAAKVMGLGYPGGPIIAKKAAEGDAGRYPLPTIDLTPKPQRDQDGFLVKPEPSLDFSFSGLKTALITIVRSKKSLTEKEQRDLSASFEKAVVSTLVQNSARAIAKYQPQTFILAGGVAANGRLRLELGAKIKELFPETSYLIPPTSLCGDNGAMIGLAAYYKIRNSAGPWRTRPGKSEIRDLGSVTANPNLKIA